MQVKTHVQGRSLYYSPTIYQNILRNIINRSNKEGDLMTTLISYNSIKATT